LPSPVDAEKLLSEFEVLGMLFCMKFMKDFGAKYGDQQTYGTSPVRKCLANLKWYVQSSFFSYVFYDKISSQTDNCR